MLNSNLEKVLFTNLWISRFVNEWNVSGNFPGSLYFLNTGPVLFGIDKDEKITRKSTLSWDPKGKVHIINDLHGNETIPAFLATVQVWESVINGYYTPIFAVVNKKMRFKGNMKFAMQFSRNFDFISDVAIRVNSSF